MGLVRQNDFRGAGCLGSIGVFMDLQKIRVRQDLERMVTNYFLRGEISEEQSNQICTQLDRIIGGGFIPKPGRGDHAKVITFPMSLYKGKPEKENPPEEKEAIEPPVKSPKIYAPYGQALPEGIPDFREALQRDGLILICYQKLTSHEGTFYDVLWAQSGTKIRCTNWSGAIREECIPYVMPLDGIIDGYKNRDLRHSLKIAYTVNVAPENVLNGPLSCFFEYVQSLKDAGMKNNFDYVFIFAAEKRNRFLIRNEELVKLKLPARLLTFLDDREIHTIKDLQRLSIQDLQKIKHIGQVIVNDTIAILKKAGITLQEGKENYV